MKKYFIDRERGFGNEYTLAVADSPDVALALEELGYERIARRRWIELLRLRHSHAGYLGPTRIGISGRGADQAHDIADIIDICADQTRLWVEDFEGSDTMICKLS